MLITITWSLLSVKNKLKNAHGNDFLNWPCSHKSVYWFDHKIKFHPLDENQDRKPNKKRGQKIVWFNSAYSRNVRTNIGKNFLLLIDKHFPNAHKLSKVFNWNNVKVSYSSMPNVVIINNSHNKKWYQHLHHATADLKELVH